VCDPAFDAKVQHNMYVKLGNQYVSVIKQCLSLNANETSSSSTSSSPFIPRFDASTHCWSYPVCHASTFVEGASDYNDCMAFNGGCPADQVCNDPSGSTPGNAQCLCVPGHACPSTDQMNQSGSSSSNAGVIAAAVIVPLAVIILCVALYCCYRNRKQRETTDSRTNSVPMASTPAIYSQVATAPGSVNGSPQTTYRSTGRATRPNHAPNGDVSIDVAAPDDESAYNRANRRQRRGRQRPVAALPEVPVAPPIPTVEPEPPASASDSARMTAKIVEYDNGKKQLHLGNEVFDIEDDHNARDNSR
jgi:hypothetical protein